MRFAIGVKTDPIEYRYSLEWLLKRLRDHGVEYLQYGTSAEIYVLPDDYFRRQRELIDSYGVTVWSCFTSHRELGGHFTGDRFLEEATERNSRRLVQIGALLGARYVGANPGSVYRDALSYKDEGIRRYIQHMNRLSVFAMDQGLEGLTLEPMSCMAEPPSTPAEVDHMMAEFSRYRAENPGRCVPVMVCGDVSHGVADASGQVIHDNMDLFIHEIPHMAEFHFKNTDKRFDSTFGFADADRERGVVDVQAVMRVIADNAARFPVTCLIGHLELSGPKLGRDYSDHLLGPMLDESLLAISNAVSEIQGESGELL